MMIWEEVLFHAVHGVISGFTLVFVFEVWKILDKDK